MNRKILDWIADELQRQIEGQMHELEGTGWSDFLTMLRVNPDFVKTLLRKDIDQILLGAVNATGEVFKNEDTDRTLNAIVEHLKVKFLAQPEPAAVTA